MIICCIAAYIEGIKKPALLERALRTAALRRKPVVVLKAGMTEKGSFAAASHTGSLAGDYATYESVFRKYGVIVTKSLQELTSTARMFSVLDGHLPSLAFHLLCAGYALLMLGVGALIYKKNNHKFLYYV